mmetsp:Transcript_16266/g.47740  ORF Transcript_16266/g.47740 Transcript_16266/m.47740 type:complete len:200 (-) Transcript_16266:658-1257(-)
MLNSFTLNRVERMAAWRAHPRETASSAFMVVDRPLLMALGSKGTPAPARMAVSRSLTKPMRVDPPTISTEEISSGANPDWARAAWIGASSRARRGSAADLNSSRVSFRKKSMSFMRHSQDMGVSDTPAGDRVFLAFSAATRSFIRTLGFSQGSSPCLALNSAAMCLAIRTSKSRPPSCRSWVLAWTASLPVTKDAAVTE